MENLELEKKEVAKTVTEAIDVHYNLGDIEKIKKYFHPGFTLLQMKENDLKVTHLFNTIERKKVQHKEGVFPSKEKISIEFEDITVSGTAATVYFKYIKSSKHTCDDFMSLYKFDEGWRIVSQTTYHHPEK